MARIQPRSPRAPTIRRIALVGNHVPRRCGIATFTTDLREALVQSTPGVDCIVAAMNDGARRYEYPAAVRLEIAESEVLEYLHAADFLNTNAVDIVSVQHEYGIFGGRAGSHLLALLRQLRMPIVTTLHTILEHPSAAQGAVMDELLQLSERVVVMSSRGGALLQQVHGVAAGKIDRIPHGIPDFPAPAASKRLLGLEGKSVILTFGLLSPDKGIEHVIDAMPAVAADFPNAVYVVLGATHPHVKAHDGEIYRLMLENRAQQLGVAAKIIFHNRFVSREELTRFLAAADIYITPYLKPEQIISGTLAYAVGCGKAVISTPYWCASELLAEDRGILVPWRDSEAIGREVLGLLGDEEKRHGYGARAAAYGRDMGWESVAGRYMESFERARAERPRLGRLPFEAQTLAGRPADLPSLKLDHLRLMTDDTGILQHAIFNVPRYLDGYCLDDNARALLVMALAEDSGTEDPVVVRQLAARYLGFIAYAFDQATGRFHNFMSYSRNWLEGAGSEDSHGRALWGLGAFVGRSKDPGGVSLASQLFHAALPAVMGFSSPRAWAYAVLGMDEYLGETRRDAEVQDALRVLGERLHGLYIRTSQAAFPWFEDRLTYCNARLPQALLVVGDRLGDEAMHEAGVAALRFLVSEQRSHGGHFAPIGSAGFYVHGGPRAAFDQQPVEACGLISACLVAQRGSGDAEWGKRARWAFNWFVGENELAQSLYDPRTGGCRDGLHADRANENQGAESSLSFLASLLEMRAAERDLAPALLRERSSLAKGAAASPRRRAVIGVAS